MLLTETQISQLIPERIFLQPVKTESFSRIVSSSDLHLKVFSDSAFEIKHFIKEEKIAFVKDEKQPLLMPDPPVAFLKPRKYDYL